MCHVATPCAIYAPSPRPPRMLPAQTSNKAAGAAASNVTAFAELLTAQLAEERRGAIAAAIAKAAAAEAAEVAEAAAAEAAVSGKGAGTEAAAVGEAAPLPAAAEDAAAAVDPKVLLSRRAEAVEAAGRPAAVEEEGALGELQFTDAGAEATVTVRALLPPPSHPSLAKSLRPAEE